MVSREVKITLHESFFGGSFLEKANKKVLMQSCFDYTRLRTTVVTSIYYKILLVNKWK
jgi:hypothetical protein